MEENFSMKWKIFSMEWKMFGMEYEKIVFHSIPWILYTSPKNTFQKLYLPEKHLAETTVSRTYICLNVHFPEITLP